MNKFVKYVNFGFTIGEVPRTGADQLTIFEVFGKLGK